MDTRLCWYFFKFVILKSCACIGSSEATRTINITGYFHAHPARSANLDVHPRPGAIPFLIPPTIAQHFYLLQTELGLCWAASIVHLQLSLLAKSWFATLSFALEWYPGVFVTAPQSKIAVNQMRFMGYIIIRNINHYIWP